jgi:hypothetical protein
MMIMILFVLPSSCPYFRFFSSSCLCFRLRRALARNERTTVLDPVYAERSTVHGFVCGFHYDRQTLCLFTCALDVYLRTKNEGNKATYMICIIMYGCQEHA